MRDLHLTSEEISDLRTAHAAERNRNAAYKINAIILLGTGWTLKKVQDALLLDTETLRSYVKNIKPVALPRYCKRTIQESKLTLTSNS